MNNDYLLVSEVNKYIKNIFESEEFLNNIYIKGEISNIKFHTRGHLYFSLKDETSKINAVMFNYSTNNLGFVPKDGDSVLIRGKVTVYEATGGYQVYVHEIKQDGVGNLHILFEELKNKLYKEGLFESNHKKRIPKIPKKIGVITASTGAAIKDIISTINRRFPMVEIILFPTLVQGSAAAPNIVNSIRKADESNLDVLIIGRGGGSIEDLWAFNEETVARAIYEANTPIISAVGHEIDYTISDFVSDLRAPTPTAAAELVVPDKNQILEYLLEAENRLNSTITYKIKHYEEILKKYKTNYILNNPISIYEIKEQKLDHIIDKLIFLSNNNYTTKKNYLENIYLKLNLLNPNNILEKGYSIVTYNNKILKNCDLVSKNDEINIKLYSGSVIGIVKEVKNGKKDI